MTQALDTAPTAARPWPGASGRPGSAVRAWARRCCAFAGPGWMVAVGYMDPGNWATSIAGGSRYGQALLAVVVASSLMAMLFQAAAVRLGLAGGEDLAQACRRHFGRRTSLALWLFSEIAIVACNLAEVLGMAIGLNLLFGLPMFAGVCVTVADVLLVLALQARGFRLVEAVVAVLVAAITACFVAQLAWARPSAGAIVHGLALAPRVVADPQMLYLAVGIVGATVMPHNLYLHSAIVRTRAGAGDAATVRSAIRWSTLDSTLALGVALFVNAAILLVAAAAFHRPGQPEVTELSDAYRLISPMLGVAAAGTVFGIGLIASGLSASITGTLAGQVVMEGFVAIRLSPARRALLTRGL
ncbi:MAG: Nramp family divalent metal transporter, partial [Vitreoscilla sp.]